MARVLRKLEASGPQLDLYRALQEVGRIETTIYLLNYLTSPELRRQVSYQRNKNESYHSLVYMLFWGHGDELRLRELEDQRNRHRCLRFVAATVILFNAAYLQATRNRWQSAGYDIPSEQLAHIYPLGSRHLLLLGDFRIDNEPRLLTQVAALPIRDPEADDFDVLA